MIKIFKLRVLHCPGCPNYYRCGQSIKCQDKDRYMDSEDMKLIENDKFPKWCPLEDKETSKLTLRQFDRKFWGKDLTDVLASDRAEYYEDYLKSGLPFDEYNRGRAS